MLQTSYSYIIQYLFKLFTSGMNIDYLYIKLYIHNLLNTKSNVQCK